MWLYFSQSYIRCQLARIGLITVYATYQSFAKTHKQFHWIWTKMHIHTHKTTTDINTFFPFAACFLESWSKGAIGVSPKDNTSCQQKKRKREKIQAEHMTYQCQSVSSVRFFYCRFENIWDDMSLLLKWILCPCGLLNHLRHLWIDRIQTTTKTSSSAKAAWRPWTASSKTACMTHGFGSFLGWIYNI